MEKKIRSWEIELAEIEKLKNELEPNEKITERIERRLK